MNSDSIKKYDNDHIWHPYSSLINPNPTFLIDSADGVYLKLESGDQLIDGMSSWWACIHGYNNSVLNKAIVDQLRDMSHVMFGGLTHRPAVELAIKLAELTNNKLKYVYFSESGSVAVEVAIKMAIQYWVSKGVFKKKKFLTMRNGYYGGTFGAMSICDPNNNMYDMFSDLIVDNIIVDAPSYETDDEWQEKDIDVLKTVLENDHNDIAAIIIEPILQNAGGMNIYCPEYLRQLRKLCDKYGILLILDEIATGFGRTGTLFAYQQADIEPDILILGKALTGGYLSLAATLSNEKVVEGISSDGVGAILHGPTFMANPLACSVANASIELFINSDWKNKVSLMEEQLRNELSNCLELSIVKDVRCKGAFGVVELKCPVDIFWMQQRFVKLGVWIRPYGKWVYITPPYIITTEELSKLTSAIYKVVSGYSDHIEDKNLL